MSVFQRLFTNKSTVVDFIADDFEVAKQDQDVRYNAIYVGGEGDLNVIPAKGNTAVTLPGMAGGVWHGIAVRKIISSGTTATNLRGNKF